MNKRIGLFLYFYVYNTSKYTYLEKYVYPYYDEF